MLSKQLTSKLKEEQERDNANNSNMLNVAQADRLIRTVSCKHEANHAIKKANINVLQTFDDIKLYVPPNYALYKNDQQTEATSDSAATLKVPTSTSASPKLPVVIDPSASNNNEILEVNFRDILNQLIENLNPANTPHWFNLNDATNTNTNNHEATSSSLSLFDSILQALNFIDFNLKRNSDFINELTKLLDTSRDRKSVV